MAELNKIRFLLLVSLMIFSARALDVILSGAHDDLKQKSEIKIAIVDGEKKYAGTLNQLVYEAGIGIFKVIVYIISRSRCIEILRPAGVARETRSQIAHELRKMHCELVFLGIENFDDDEHHLIGAFLLEKIRPRSDLPGLIVETIGENRFDNFYGYYLMNFDKYQENVQICGGTLLARLRSIPHGALRPIGSNNKEIKLCAYQPFVRKEPKWCVSVENNTYVPNVDLNDPNYNFMIKYPNKKICLLILGGKEYLAFAGWGNRGLKRLAMKQLLKAMAKNDEVLIILGVFNFDWTEIDIVTQIILKHSEGSQSSGYNVFTCGYGMFNTYYQNVYENDERDIRQQPNSYVTEVIELLMGGEAKERAINVYYYCDNDLRWKALNMPINLSNGRYIPELRFNNFTVPRQYQKIAFIVYDRAEMDHPIDYSVVLHSVEELKQSGINVVLIDVINFGLDDMHIIAEWMDRHSGVIDLEQIAVLGGGIFDTIFQSESTTYNTFLNTKKNELKAIRNAYVTNGNAKSVSAVQIDDYKHYEVWSYPMNTVVNGFYEPDLIPDRKIFNTLGERKIFFIVTTAYHFRRISTISVKNLISLTSSLRRKIKGFYPDFKWIVYLVGLDNFEDRDSHLFAELINRQTKDGRRFEEFVRTFNYGMNEAIYQYKDNAPFDVESRLPIQEHFMSFVSDANAHLHMINGSTDH